MATLQITFVSESAGYDNVLGWYNSRTGEAGIIFINTNDDGPCAGITAGTTATIQADQADIDAGTIGFFQAHPVFDRASAPELDARFERLTMEIENLNTTELSNLWGILGSRYLPSVLYRLRMVTIDEGQVVDQPLRVLRPEAALQG